MKPERKAKTPLHLRLTTEDWVECFKKLSRAELGVLYYIRTKDPYGDRNLEIDCSELGKLLGIHRTSISRALEELKKKGFIDMEIEKAKVRQKINNRKLTLLTSQGNESNNEQSEDLGTCASTHSLCADAQPFAPTHTSVHPCTAECADAQPCAPTQKTQPEPALDKDSSAPHTIQTYSDFINTLSDGEREIFEKFVREEWKRLKGEDVINMERFLAKEEDFKSWHQSFLNSPAGKEAKKKAIALYDWTQHPDWENWLAMMRQGVPRFVALGTCFDNKTRRAIADWALERNLVWGTES